MRDQVGRSVAVRRDRRKSKTSASAREHLKVGSRASCVTAVSLGTLEGRSKRPMKILRGVWPRMYAPLRKTFSNTLYVPRSASRGRLWALRTSKGAPGCANGSVERRVEWEMANARRRGRGGGYKGLLPATRTRYEVKSSGPTRGGRSCAGLGSEQSSYARQDRTLVARRFSLGGRSKTNLIDG